MQAIVQCEEIEILPDLSQYDIQDVAEIYYNPSYDLLFGHETAPSLSGHERATVIRSRIGEYRRIYRPLPQRQISGEG